MPITLADIHAARSRIQGHVYRSPCPPSAALSRLCGAEVLCKLDHLQATGSFKERGARNRLELLSPAERHVGVVAASAGNHALGLARHGADLGIPVTVVMPIWAPLVKVDNCRQLGADVVQHGESFAGARERALAIAHETGKAFIPAYDDPAIMAGQGTIGVEILEDVPDVDAIFVPVGGGGLIAGIATAVKTLRPQCQIIGVEPEHAPSMHRSLAAGRPVSVDPLPTLADGLAVPVAGTHCLEVCQRLVDEVVLVGESALAQAIVRLLEHEKTVLEGAGAAALAGALAPGLLARRGLVGKRIVLVLCGGNIDLSMLNRVIERAFATDGRLCRIHCDIADRPGALARLLAVVAEAGGNVKEVDHDRNFGPVDPARVASVLTLETRGHDHIARIHAALTAAGIAFRPG
jgi:threonine dehydratase